MARSATLLREGIGQQARGTLRALTIATAVGSLGLAAGGTATPLLAAQMRHTEAVAGIPLGLLVAGSAVGALLISRRTSRADRASSLSLGYVVGALGSLVVIAGAVSESFAVVLAGSFLLGPANAAVFLTRYAAADAGGPGSRGRALGLVFFATAIGAVASPSLMQPSGRIATALGLPELTGLFVLAAPAFLIAALVLATAAGGKAPTAGQEHGDRPEPYDADGPTDAVSAIRSASAGGALLVLGVANLVMVGIMAIAPIHLVSHGHGLGFVGVVVSVHVAGMFGPSPLTGWLADRLGSAPVVALGLTLLAAAGTAALLLEVSTDTAILIFLTVVGLGWNAAVVGGSAWLATALPPGVRPHGEGLGEAAMGLAAGVGAPGAGVLMAVGGFGAIGAAAILATAPAVVTVILVRRRDRPHSDVLGRFEAEAEVRRQELRRCVDVP